MMLHGAVLRLPLQMPVIALQIVLTAFNMSHRIAKSQCAWGEKCVGGNIAPVPDCAPITVLVHAVCS